MMRRKIVRVETGKYLAQIKLLSGKKFQDNFLSDKEKLFAI